MVHGVLSAAILLKSGRMHSHGLMTTNIARRNFLLNDLIRFESCGLVSNSAQTASHLP
jgi:hypothetical protein